LTLASEHSSSLRFERTGLGNWCALIVLVAVCSLTVSLATRYYAPLSIASQTIKSVHTHASADAKKQRLAKDAIDWAPPLSRTDVLRIPTFYAVAIPPIPQIPNLFLQYSLYNHPPPFSKILG